LVWQISTCPFTTSSEHKRTIIRRHICDHLIIFKAASANPVAPTTTFIGGPMNAFLLELQLIVVQNLNILQNTRSVLHRGVLRTEHSHPLHSLTHIYS
jgi:hypothetical protein